MYQLNLICGKDILRPALNYIKVDSEFCTATNTHAIARIPTNLIFSDKFTEFIHEETIFIKSDNYKQIKNGYLCTDVDFKESLIKFEDNKGSKLFIPFEMNLNGFPSEWSINSVIDGHFNKENSINNISINPDLLLKCYNALVVSKKEYNKINLSFKDKAAVITNKEHPDIKCVLMLFLNN